MATDSVPQRRAAPPASAAPPAFAEPRWVMARSLLVPGWGQVHNRAWLKALVIGGADLALRLQVIDDERTLSRLLRESETARREQDAERFAALVARYNARLDRANARRWLLGGVLLYSLLDAFVDAHFLRFDVELEDDPAAPRGGPPGLRLAVNRTW